MRLTGLFQRHPTCHRRIFSAVPGLALAMIMSAGSVSAETHSEKQADRQIPGGCIEPVISAKATSLEREAKLVGYLLCLEEQASTTHKIESALQSRAMAHQSSAMRQNPPSMRAERRSSAARASDSMAHDRTPPSLFR